MNLRFPKLILLWLALAVVAQFLVLRWFPKAPAVGLTIGLGGLVLVLIYVIFRLADHLQRDDEAPEGKGGFQRPFGIAELVTGLFVLLLIGLIVVAGSVGILSGDVAATAVMLLVLGMLGLVFRLAISFYSRWTVARIVIGQVAAVLRQNLPLATAVALAAEAEQGSSRLHLHRIARLLGHGLGLAEAIRRGYPDCPSLPLSLIMAGERAGQLSAAVDQAEQHLIDHGRRREVADAPASLYLLVLLGMTILMVSGIMVAVVPKFKEIFKDFGVELPAVTLALMDFSEFMAMSGLFALLVLGVVIGIPAVLYLSVRPRRIDPPRLTSQFADWFRWHLPGWRRLEFSKGMASALGIMRLAARAGLGLSTAARLAAEVDVNLWLRRRLLGFSMLVEGGAQLREAARQSGLGEVTGIALASGQRSGNLDAALRFAGDYHAALVSHWWIFLRSLAWPLATLLVATLVGWVVLALFTPLVALIDASGT